MEEKKKEELKRKLMKEETNKINNENAKLTAREASKKDKTFAKANKKVTRNLSKISLGIRSRRVCA